MRGRRSWIRQNSVPGRGRDHLNSGEFSYVTNWGDMMIFAAADRILDCVSDRGLAYLYRRTPPSLLDGLARYRFRRTVRWVAERSPFYREAFRALGIDARRVHVPPPTWAISSPRPTI